MTAADLAAAALAERARRLLKHLGVVPPSRLLARLERETRFRRSEAEAASAALLGAPTGGQYALYLRRAYGLEAPIESSFAITPHLGSLVDLRARSSAGLIAADLLALGLRAADLARLPLCPEVRPFDSVAEGLGWMFAYERGAFHLIQLREQIARALPDQVAIAGRYLACHHPRALGERWRELGVALDRISGSAAVEDRVLAAAEEAYLCQRDWFGEELRSQRAG